MRYRLATKTDIDHICHFIKLAIKHMEDHEIYQWDDLYPAKDDFMTDIEAGDLYVGTVDDKIAVVFALNQESDDAYKDCKWEGRDEKACILHRLCVSPIFQNQGIGKETLEYIEKLVASMGYESIRLDAFTENPYALWLYEKAGYVIRGYANWRKGKFVLMEKGL